MDIQVHNTLLRIPLSEGELLFVSNQWIHQCGVCFPVLQFHCRMLLTPQDPLPTVDQMQNIHC